MKIINENIKAMCFFFFVFVFCVCVFFFLKKEYTNFVGAFFSNISQRENLLCVSEKFSFLHKIEKKKK